MPRTVVSFVTFAFVAFVAFVPFGAFVSSAAAQQLPRPVPPVDGGLTPGQVQQLFDAMLVMQAPDALSLSDQQYAQFLPRLRVLLDARRKALLERMRLINELQRLTNPRNPQPNVTETEIRERLSALEELDARSTAELRKAYDAIDEILDVRQQARFRVFEEQIERRKLDLIARARQRNQNRQLPPKRPPPR